MLPCPLPVGVPRLHEHVEVPPEPERGLRRPVVPHRPISPRATLISTRISAGTPFSERLLRICAKQSSPAREQGPAVQGVGRRPLTRKLARMAPESAQAAIRDGRDGLGGLGWWWELRS